MAETTQTVIKLLSRQEDGRLVSYFARGEWRKEYSTEEWTKPDEGLLFAYPADTNLVLTAMLGLNDEVWLAEAVVVKTDRLHLSVNLMSWSNWWGCFNNDPKTWYDSLADRVSLCSAIRLVKCIKVARE